MALPPPYDRLVHKIAYLNSRYEQSQLLNTKGNLPLTHLSTFTRNKEVTVVGHSAKFQRNGGEEPQLTVCDWLYTGPVEDNPHKVTPPDGTMGSAIVDEGAVLGFWDCCIPTGLFAGMANAVSASELSGRGFFLMPG